jgi:hypothetical protein
LREKEKERHCVEIVFYSTTPTKFIFQNIENSVFSLIYLDRFFEKKILE